MIDVLTSMCARNRAMRAVTAISHRGPDEAG
jgi:hypothetical protein